MTTIIVTLHIIACFGLIALVLLQSGKEGMGVIFGGGSASVFGSTGAGGLLVKLTAICGAVFLCTSLAYNYFSSTSHRSAKSIMMDVKAPETPEAPKAAADAPKDVKAPVQFEDAKPQGAAPMTPGGATTPAPAVDPLAPQGAAKN